jgi:hypothetical protein
MTQAADPQSPAVPEGRGEAVVLEVKERKEKGNA